MEELKARIKQEEKQEFLFLVMDTVKVLRRGV